MSHIQGQGKEESVSFWNKAGTIGMEAMWFSGACCPKNLVVPTEPQKFWSQWETARFIHGSFFELKGAISYTLLYFWTKGSRRCFSQSPHVLLLRRSAVLPGEVLRHEGRDCVHRHQQRLGCGLFEAVLQGHQPPEQSSYTERSAPTSPLLRRIPQICLRP